MRTTLEIDDDVMEAARAIARVHNQGIGRALSELARQGLSPQYPPVIEVEHGIPVWTHAPGAISVTSEMVRSLADDE